MDTATGRFTYVYLPCDNSKPLEERSESADGGLENDRLIAALRSGTEIGPNVDIVAVTIPSSSNQYEAVSLYCNGNANSSQLPVNDRVMGIMRAAGLAPSNDVRGDAVLSRYVDNEQADVWKRIDFTAADCSSDSPWILAAAASQRQRGRAMSPGSSLSGMLQQAAGLQKQKQQQNANKLPEGCTFTASTDEIELTVPLPDGGYTKKDISVKFSTHALEVDVAGKSIIRGDLGGAIDLDGSTWTLDGAKKSVIISLEKRYAGQDWPFILDSQRAS